MSKLMQHFPRRIRVLAVALLAAALPAAAQAAVQSLACGLWSEEADGTWDALRYVDGATGATESRDTYQWISKQVSLGTGATFSWNLTYHWPRDATRQKAVPERDVVVGMDFRFNAKEIGQPLKDPGHTWIHLYRFADPARRFSVHSTSLTNTMDWTRLQDGSLYGRALLSLDTVLAFGTDLDALVWNIRRGPDPLGVTESEFAGALPVLAMRGKMARVPQLRLALDRKAANFRSECKAPIMMGQ